RVQSPLLSFARTSSARVLCRRGMSIRVFANPIFWRTVGRAQRTLWSKASLGDAPQHCPLAGKQIAAAFRGFFVEPTKSARFAPRFLALPHTYSADRKSSPSGLQAHASGLKPTQSLYLRPQTPYQDDSGIH